MKRRINILLALLIYTCPIRVMASSSTLFILAVDEQCSVCEQILNDPLLPSKQFIVGSWHSPSFRWQARLKRKGIMFKIHSLAEYPQLNKESFSPILYVVNKHKIEKYYGKSKILQYLRLRK